jgi:hypothetical protein
MNAGGRPTGSKSAEAEARKRKADEQHDPGLMKKRVEAGKLAKMNFFKAPAQPVLGAKSPARPSSPGGLARPSSPGGSGLTYPGGSGLTYAMGFTYGDKLTLPMHNTIDAQSPEAATAMEILYPDPPAALKDRDTNTIYTVKGQMVKWNGKRDYVCVCAMVLMGAKVA